MMQKSLSLLWLLSFLPALALAEKPVNVLFIITDQQRWDTLGCMGNKIIKTPNLDRLAAEGARFTRMYSSCPVCVPARTVILTGQSCETNRIITNEEINREDLPDLLSFDQILFKHGWHGEYYGKWHSPYRYALDYVNGVRWVNGPPPPGTRADLNEGKAFAKYLDEHVPLRALQPGEQLANLYNRPYRPDPLDGAYGLPPEQVQKIMRDRKAAAAQQIGQGFSYGCLDVPPEHTLAAWTVKEGLEALDRLKDGPFSLTVSIGPPHPPMVLPKPYYGMYPPEDMPVPASNNDSREESPYFKSGSAPASYHDKDKIRQMISDYYGMITLNDDWIGKLLGKLDELHLSENTLVVFTADHGEMLGDHGMLSKFVFYEGSAHIPLLMRLPGRIKAGTVVDAPVAQMDLFSTILDYCGIAGQKSEGDSLRPWIEGRGKTGRVIVSEWNGTAVPGYMVTDGRWKLMFGRGLAARARDALFDLETDPLEMKNLLAVEADRTANQVQAERLKQSLLDWLTRNNSTHVEEVRARSIVK